MRAFPFFNQPDRGFPVFLDAEKMVNFAFFMKKRFFFHWPLGDGAPWATTQYLVVLELDKYVRNYMAGRVTS